MGFKTLTYILFILLLASSLPVHAQSYCPDPSHNYCPGQSICDQEPDKCNIENGSGCYYKQAVWLAVVGDPTAAPFCYTEIQWKRDQCSNNEIGSTWLSPQNRCDPINPDPNNTPTPPTPPTGGGGGGAPAPAAQPLVLIGGNGLLDCPTGAADCGACPPNTGSSDAAACGASAFSNSMIESLSRQAATSTVADDNLRAATALGSDYEGIH